MPGEIPRVSSVGLCLPRLGDIVGDDYGFESDIKYAGRIANTCVKDLCKCFPDSSACRQLACHSCNRVEQTVVQILATLRRGGRVEARKRALALWSQMWESVQPHLLQGWRPPV